MGENSTSRIIRLLTDGGTPFVADAGGEKKIIMKKKQSREQLLHFYKSYIYHLQTFTFSFINKKFLCNLTFCSSGTF